MSLLSHLHSRASVDCRVTVAVPVGRAAELPIPPMPTASRTGDVDRSRLHDARSLVTVLLADGHDDSGWATLEAGVEESVDVWTPAMHTSTRFDLVSALAAADDAIGDVVVGFTEWGSSAETVFLSWQATGRFARPAFLDDDHIVEPDGSVIRLAGLSTVTFGPNRRATRIRCYYDRMTLIERLCASSSVPDVG